MKYVKTYTLPYIIFLYLISCREKELSNLNGKEILSDKTIMVSNKNAYKLETDSTILRTDNYGNILGGDLRDWDFDNKNYEYILLQEFYEMYNNPDKIYIGEEKSFIFDVKNNSVRLTWFTSVELNCKGFEVERNTVSDKTSDWKTVGYIKGNGNSERLITYNYIDKNLSDGKYRYRLKQIFSNEEYEYHVLSNPVTITNFEKMFEFYPVYPNPVSEKFIVRVFLSEKDTVSLYFVNGNDTTYILNHEPQVRGFYKLTVDKKTLGFENEIKRLYINCKTCDKKRYFGDIQF